MHCEELKGKEHLFQIVAACARSPERREKMAQRYPGCKTYATLDALLADPNEGIERFVHGALLNGSRDGNGIKDIKIFFQTYSINGD